MSRRRVLAVAAFIVLAGIGLALDPRGLRHSWALLADLERIEGEIQTLREANEALRFELASLAEDPAALERVAREELGLIKADELIFHLEGEDEALVP